jgi:hypothetical protein
MADRPDGYDVAPQNSSTLERLRASQILHVLALLPFASRCKWAALQAPAAIRSVHDFIK